LPRRFVYVIAFKDDKFLMVLHKIRAWEMPGGRLDWHDESYAAAAVREFREETGYSLKLIGEVLGLEPRAEGKVLVGLVTDEPPRPITDPKIAEVCFFDALPRELSFPDVEYISMLAQAKRMLETFKKGKAISAFASPLTQAKATE
jgi:8-oxo-dGTP pyrophosphatase MutT (NUDIX family)